MLNKSFKMSLNLKSHIHFHGVAFRKFVYTLIYSDKGLTDTYDLFCLPFLNSTIPVSNAKRV